MRYRSLLVLVLGTLLVSLCSRAQTTGLPKTKEPIAIIAGEEIYEDELLPLVKGQMLPLRRQEYEIKNRAVEKLIDQKVLEAEAKKKGLTNDQLLQQEVDAKIQDPTGGETEAYYLAQRDRLNRPFAEVKSQLQQALKQARIQHARLEYIQGLRTAQKAFNLLSPPEVQVAVDPARVRGNPKAPVVIVEFSDFQCPYCRKAYPIVKELLAKYEGKVSLAYRDFPLVQIHPQAQLAAEASRCAEEQGKFWEYHDLLFTGGKLDRDALLEQARSLKLDDKQFQGCLESGKYKAAVDEDAQEGMQAGVNGTPGFFINGVALSGAQPADAFVKIIDQQLARKLRAPVTSAR